MISADPFASATTLEYLEGVEVVTELLVTSPLAISIVDFGCAAQLERKVRAITTAVILHARMRAFWQRRCRQIATCCRISGVDTLFSLKP